MTDSSNYTTLSVQISRTPRVSTDQYISPSGGKWTGESILVLNIQIDENTHIRLYGPRQFLLEMLRKVNEKVRSTPLVEEFLVPVED